VVHIFRPSFGELRLVDPVKLVLLGAIRVYQSTVGPALPPSCRFEPSCSRYAYEAIDRYGALRGSWLALRRLARCQPFGGHGYDPVP
jgi:putative membrane protein insertion efficiency factor